MNLVLTHHSLRHAVTQLPDDVLRGQITLLHRTLFIARHVKIPRDDFTYWVSNYKLFTEAYLYYLCKEFHHRFETPHHLLPDPPPPKVRLPHTYPDDLSLTTFITTCRESIRLTRRSYFTKRRRPVWAKSRKHVAWDRRFSEANTYLPVITRNPRRIRGKI